MENLSALDYAKLGCNTLMKKFNPAKNLPPVKRFHYHQGVFLTGMERVYELCGDEKYFNYIKEWVDSFIDENGILDIYDEGQFDDLQPAMLLFKIYDKTGDEKYKKILDYIMKLYKNWPLNPEGGFWHKTEHPNEMWLDSMYMASMLPILYDKHFSENEHLEVVYKQMTLMWKNMRDKDTGLLYHAWDYTKNIQWADKNTGLSPEFWGRAIGWYVVALFDIAEYLPDDYTHKSEFIQNGTELIKSIFNYQDKESKLWFQVLNKGYDPNNWIENSCSCLFVYALSKAVRLGYIDKAYMLYADDAYEAIIKRLRAEGEDILIDDICIGTGVCDYEEYLSRPKTQNDLHGMGAFVLMCTEYHKTKKGK